jgi:hypothetical protein
MTDATAAQTSAAMTKDKTWKGYLVTRQSLKNKKTG